MTSMRRPRRGILRHFERVGARSTAGNTFAPHRYLNEPLLDAANHPFMATLDKAAYDPLTAWTRGTLDLPSFQKKPRMDGAYRFMPYIAASAMAYHGGVAAAARNERTFRDTSFINGALQQKMLPKTIARTGLLRRNTESRAPIEKAAERLVDERKRPRS